MAASGGTGTFGKRFRKWKHRKEDLELRSAVEGLSFVRDLSSGTVEEVQYRLWLEVMLSGGQAAPWLVLFEFNPSLGEIQAQLRCSRELAGLLGYQPSELARLPSEWRNGLLHPDDGDLLLDRHSIIPTTGVLRYEMEVRVRTRSGEYRWYRLRGLSVFVDDRVQMAGGTLEDIQKKKENQEALLFAASRDGLTGLGNQIALQDALQRALTVLEMRRAPFAIVYLDVDRFKKLNDAHGHLFGDEVLKEVGARIVSSLRPKDFISRPHGDEFVAIVRGVQSPRMLKLIATRLALAVSKPVSVGESTVDVSASMGLVLVDKPLGHSAEEILCAADMAMYDAKRAHVAWRIAALPRCSSL